ncbi:MAG: hypothetical protein NC206_10095 [Bacteroides sp.]|nr:hypothetical protein [Roseburia sp.]MCM1347418.1 hypothetical protein [Bacteroides sp.]MCM1421578.1 hypothetical protein [Bacteroides sp.]
MADMTTLSSPQLIVTVEDASIINELKRAIKMMRGVSKISVVRNPRKTELELARKDAQAGRVTKWENVDEMFKGILGE